MLKGASAAQPIDGADWLDALRRGLVQSQEFAARVIPMLFGDLHGGSLSREQARHKEETSIRQAAHAITRLTHPLHHDVHTGIIAGTRFVHAAATSPGLY
jgi:succinylglutamate desuccinylase